MQRAPGLPRALLAALLSAVAACTMPLPIDTPVSTSPLPGSSPSAGPGSNSGQSQVVPLAQVFLRSGLYDGQAIRYLDLNTCALSDPVCINRLNTPLSTLIRYEFFFSDASPVIGQNPVFNAPREGEPDSPFRRVVRVFVPDGYRPNSITSSQDVAASQFRTEDTQRVLNNPMISGSGATVPLTIGRAWLQGRETAYLDIGTVPFSPARNQLGEAAVYFLRNHDKSDLPTQPAPIFDTIPGELLYSPIRKVFRAVAENQAERAADDPSVGIRSQEALLRAVNQGVFRLEDTGEFFNYPFYQIGQPVPDVTYALSLAAVANLPPLPADAYYALWVTNQLSEARLLLRFRGEGGSLQEVGGAALTVGSGAPIFSFSQAEIETFRHFLVTIEQGEVSQPTGSTLLEARYDARSETELAVPFAASYRSLQPGTYMLAAPTSQDSGLQGSGVWFVQRSDTASRTPPLNRDLDPGLIMSLPPRGWSYNGWVLTELRNPIWLQTGRFRAVNQPDAQQRYLGNQGAAYTFPGEDFLSRAPEGLVFPLELSSTGERELVVSLEPDNLRLQRPFFSLYRTVLARGTPEFSNQTLPTSPVAFPSLRLRLSPP